MTEHNPVRFRLYPEPGRSRLHVTAFVWPTRAAFRRHAKRITGRSYRDADGCCIALKVRSFRGRTPRTKPLFAEVHMHRGRLGMEPIAHEMFHATVAWGYRRGIPFGRLTTPEAGPASDEEEMLAYAHGEMCRQFNLRARRAGLYS